MTEKQMADTEAQTLWRFRDLKAKGIVADRATLRRWMKSPDHPFPSPIVLSANSIAWRASEVREWLDNRPRGPAPQPRHQEAERLAQLQSGSLPDSLADSEAQERDPSRPRPLQTAGVSTKPAVAPAAQGEPKDD
jgi:predicted DNA-binding transcriptional regulator AlpA